MGSLVQFVIERSRLTVFLITMALATGTSVYLTQARQEDPEITMRKAQVVASFPGLPTERVEELLIKPIEEVIKTMPEVKRISSTALPGLAIVMPELAERYFDLKPIWTDLRNKMADLESRLPEGTQYLRVNDDFGRVAVITLALTGEGFTPREFRWQAEELRDRLVAIPLAAKVDLYGVQDERIWLELDPARLNRLGIDPSSIISELQVQNVILPGGSVVASGMSIIIQPSGNFQTLDDISQVAVPTPNNGSVYLRDLLTIRRGYEDPPAAPVLFNGEPAVVLGISMVPDSNIAELGRQMTALLTELRNEIPLGMDLQILNYQPQLVAEAVAGATENLWQTVVVVLLVVMLFLGWRTGLVVGSGIPLTILLVLVGMSLWGIPLHRISIAAIIVALGLLVDNGIVVAEDVQRRLTLGNERLKAVTDSARDLALPLLVSSLTTILAFLPLMLAENTSGEFLASLTQVVILALLFSWLLAVSVIPAMCYWFLPLSVKQPGREAKPAGQFYELYERVLRLAIRHRRTCALFCYSLVFVALALMSEVKQRNMPPSERSQFTIYLSLPAGSDISGTIAASQQLANFLTDKNHNPEIIANAAYIASGGPRFFLALQPPEPLSHSAFFIVNVEDYQQLPRVMERVEIYMADQLPQARGRTETLFLGNSPIGTVEIRLTGPDIRKLQVLSELVKQCYRDIPGIKGLRSDWENPILSMRLEIDQDLAGRAGLSSQSVARTLSTLLDGVTVSDFREREKVIPIVVRSGHESRHNLDALHSLEFYSQKNGVPVPLTQVAEFKGVVEPSQIRRVDQKRTVTLAAKHPELGSKELYALLKPKLAGIDLPPGYELGPAGEIADSKESQAELFRYAPHCLMGILALLVFQFNSLRRALLVMSTIPLILIGAVSGLLIFNAYFEFPALLGLFSLAGIIINNSIVMIDRMEQELSAGKNIVESSVSAALIRVRPILITTTTTVVGLIPLVLFGGEFWHAMSLVIICGLAVGTLQTLFFVPATYVLLNRWKGDGIQTEGLMR